jgi:hypothetical protein
MAPGSHRDRCSPKEQTTPIVEFLYRGLVSLSPTALCRLRELVATGAPAECREAQRRNPSQIGSKDAAQYSTQSPGPRRFGDDPLSSSRPPDITPSMREER